MINHQDWQANLLDETGSGIVISPGNPEEGALQFNTFIQNNNRLKNARIADKKLADANFGRDMFTSTLLKIFTNFNSPYIEIKI